MKLKNFLKICSYTDCIFGIYIANRKEPIEEFENVKDKDKLKDYLDGVITNVYPYNENKIAICVFVERLSIGKQLELAGYNINE